MPMQLTADGIEVYTQPEIQQLIEDDLKAQFGALDVSAESVTGQMIGVYSKPPTDISELIEDVYLSFSPNNAEGISLDYLLQINGLIRLPATSSVCPCGFKGSGGTVIPQGTVVLSEAPNNDEFETITEITISNLQQLKIYVSIDEIIDSTDYIITIDGTSYTVNSGTGATIDSIAALLKTEIDNDVSAVVTASIQGINNNVLLIEANTVAFDTTLNITQMSYWTYADIQSVEKGAIPVVESTITIIDTPVTGFDEIENFQDGTTGRDIETDAEARLRRLESLQVLGAGTLPAMVARMQRDIEGAITVIGFENRTDVVDGEGRPPHSTEIVIQGGDDQEIGDLLWEIKPGGIETHGNTTVIITDGNGDPQSMNFTRPVNKYAHIRVTLTLHAEETFPGDGATQVANAIKEYGDNFQIGQDLIRDRFCIPVFTVEGIETVSTEMDLTNNIGDAPSYSSADIIPVSATEIAIFDLSNIEVIII